MKLVEEFLAGNLANPAELAPDFDLLIGCILWLAIVVEKLSAAGRSPAERTRQAGTQARRS